MDATPKNPAELSDEERKVLVENIYVTFPRLDRTLQKMAYCHMHSKISAEPECLLITGLQGAGKTTLCEAYARRYPPRSTREGRIVPVLSTFVPAIISTRSLPTKLLYELGDSAAERGTAVAQTLRIINLLDVCGVEIVILDEFQHFIDSDSNSVLVNVSDWLKDLINESEKPVMLVGMPQSEEVLRANPQLERRFSMRESLEPFGWRTPAEREEFKSFLKHLDRGLPFARRSNLSDHETALRIYCATGGLIGYVMKLVRRAAILAIENKADSLDLELLAESYDERLSSRTPGGGNPFLDDLKRLGASPPPRATNSAKKTNRRSKAKAATYSAAEVLGRKGR